MLLQTGLTLVAIRDAGHNPVKACGLLFAYLEGICKRTLAGRPQLWTPAAAQKAEINPWDELVRVADHRHVDAQDLFDAHRLTESELGRDPLA